VDVAERPVDDPISEYAHPREELLASRLVVELGEPFEGAGAPLVVLTTTHGADTVSKVPVAVCAR